MASATKWWECYQIVPEVPRVLCSISSSTSMFFWQCGKLDRVYLSIKMKQAVNQKILRYCISSHFEQSVEEIAVQQILPNSWTKNNFSATRFLQEQISRDANGNFPEYKLEGSGIWWNACSISRLRKSLRQSLPWEAPWKIVSPRFLVRYPGIDWKLSGKTTSIR